MLFLLLPPLFLPIPGSYKRNTNTNAATLIHLYKIIPEKTYTHKEGPKINNPISQTYICCWCCCCCCYYFWVGLSNFWEFRWLFMFRAFLCFFFFFFFLSFSLRFFYFLPCSPSFSSSLPVWFLFWQWSSFFYSTFLMCCM